MLYGGCNIDDNFIIDLFSLIPNYYLNVSWLYTAKLVLIMELQKNMTLPWNFFGNKTHIDL